LLSKVFQIFFLAVAARYLGTGGFGQWSLIFLFIGFFGLVADFGIDRMTVRDVARNLDSSRLYLSNTLVFKFLFLVPTLSILLGVVYSVDYPKETVDLILIALPILCLGTLVSPFSSIIQAHEKIHIISIVDILYGLTTSLLGAGLLIMGFGIKSLIIMNIVLSIIRFIIIVIICHGIVGRLWHPLSKEFIGRLVRNAFPFAALNILALIHWKVDYFMISKILGDEQLGLYAASYKIFENIVMMGATINAALYPSISALFGESKEKLRRVYERIQKYFIISSLPVAILLFLFSEEIILFIYGDQYMESVRVMYVLSLGFGVFFFTIPMRLIINNSKLIFKVVPFSMFTTGLNIVLNLFMIPRYGIIGAAMVSLLAGSADVIIRVFFIRKVFQEESHPLRSGWKPLVGALVMISIILIFSSVNKFILALISLSAYVYILVLMKELGPMEYRLFIREPIGKLFPRS
jgi:O-antigen/teichoic acid export membrane protein